MAPGTDYSNCVAVHAEANVLLYTRREDLQGSTLYVTREPCSWCDKLIKATSIERVVYLDSKGRMCLIDKWEL